MMAEKKPAPKGSPAKKKKPAKNMYQMYTISGDKIQRTNKTCPKCGPGMFLGAHNNRVYCGSCHYTEFTGKK